MLSCFGSSRFTRAEDLVNKWAEGILTKWTKVDPTIIFRYFLLYIAMSMLCFLLIIGYLACSLARAAFNFGTQNCSTFLFIQQLQYSIIHLAQMTVSEF